MSVTRIGRHDVSASTTPATDARGAAASGAESGASSSQPGIWTFVDFEAPEECAEELAEALADGLLADDGWWADFTVYEEHVIVFAKKVFRYQIGDADGRNEAVEYGLRAGTPHHQLDWGD